MKPTMVDIVWTKEYCGVQHLGEFSLRKTWFTVERYNNGAELNEWFPGCKFSPIVTWYDSVEDAMKAGEDIFHSRVKIS